LTYKDKEMKQFDKGVDNYLEGLSYYSEEPDKKCPRCEEELHESTLSGLCESCYDDMFESVR